MQNETQPDLFKDDEKTEPKIVFTKEEIKAAFAALISESQRRLME